MLNFILLPDYKDEVVKNSLYECKAVYEKTFNRIHWISFLINTKSEIKHVFNKFKTSDHH